MTHAYTRHGHSCCDHAPVGPRPGAVARCGGPGMCTDCSAHAAQIHAAPEFPAGTPEYERYAAELRTELDKFANREAPYDAEPSSESHPYYFTFGSDHLAGRGFHRYVVIHATSSEEARERMIARFGTAWSFQYADAERVGIAKYDLMRIDYATGEDMLTLDLLSRARDSIGLGLGSDRWLADYDRWLATRRK